MSASVSSSTPLQNNKSSSHRSSLAFWPVFFWAAIQGLALLAAALRIPFSARFPVPEEQMAVHEMFFVQIFVSSMCFPILFPTLGTSLVVVGSSVVMTQLAGVLAGEGEAIKMTFECAYVALWLLGLALLAHALPTRRSRLSGVATVTIVTIGGAILAYLHHEFGAPGQSYSWAGHGYLGPLMGAMTLIEAGERTGSIWAFLGTFLLCAFLMASWRWRATRMHKTSPP